MADQDQASRGRTVRRRYQSKWSLRTATVGQNVRVTGSVFIRGRGDIVIGDGVVLDAAEVPIELFALDGARIELGSGAYIGPGASIEAGKSVTIGPGAHLGAFAKIMDNNWHVAGGDPHEVPMSWPVVVGAGARVGTRATMLPGSSLDAGAVLGDDSVLTKQAPKNAIMVGVPARLVNGQEVSEPVPVPMRTAAHLTPSPWPPAVTAIGPTTADSPNMLWLTAREKATHLPRSLLPVIQKADRIVTLINARWQLRSAKRIRRAFVAGRLEVRNGGLLEVGDDVGFEGGPIRSQIDVRPEGELTIGACTGFNYGVFIRVEQCVRIGSRCLFGSRVTVLDRHGDAAGPVVIEDDVWLAHGATVLPGVTIGRGSVVGAGAVVDADVPPGSVASGSPLRFRSLADTTGAT